MQIAWIFVFSFLKGEFVMFLADSLREIAIQEKRHQITKEDADWELERVLEEDTEHDED